MAVGLDRHLVLIEMEDDNLVAVLEFIFADPWRFLGVVVMILIYQRGGYSMLILM